VETSGPSAHVTALRDDAVLRRVRYLGSARDGLGEWQLQRWTAIALIPLALYFVASILSLTSADQATVARWLSGLGPALLVMLLMAAALAHSYVGLRSIFADYVHERRAGFAIEVLLRAATAVLLVGSILAVLKISLGRMGA
jgi:succinate dehydrogenase / fumarate reductase, membrane anchor subunit